MKWFLISLIFSFSNIYAETHSFKKSNTKKSGLDIKELKSQKLEKAADCDKKEPIKIEPKSISLQGGSSGCSLDQAH